MGPSWKIKVYVIQFLTAAEISLWAFKLCAQSLCLCRAAISVQMVAPVEVFVWREISVHFMNSITREVLNFLEVWMKNKTNWQWAVYTGPERESLLETERGGVEFQWSIFTWLLPEARGNVTSLEELSFFPDWPVKVELSEQIHSMWMASSQQF